MKIAGWIKLSRFSRHSFVYAVLALIFACIIIPSSAYAACVGPADCSTPVSVCSDGAIFAGCAGEDYHQLFITRCDAGLTFSGGTCPFSAALTFPWNNANTTGYTTTNVTNFSDGQANTEELITIDSDSITAGNQPHQAAQYCADLDLHGHQDWYLPARDELALMELITTELNNISSWNAGSYWSSTDFTYNGPGNNNSAWYSWSDTMSFTTKNSALKVRCARRNDGGGCSSPAGEAGTMIYDSTDNVLLYCNGGEWVEAGPNPGTGGAGCSSPSGVAGSMIYNTGGSVLQYCDGGTWRRIGK